VIVSIPHRLKDAEQAGAAVTVRLIIQADHFAMVARSAGVSQVGNRRRMTICPANEGAPQSVKTDGLDDDHVFSGARSIRSIAMRF
jgi:hypothetical protein